MFVMEKFKTLMIGLFISSVELGSSDYIFLLTSLGLSELKLSDSISFIGLIFL